VYIMALFLSVVNSSYSRKVMSEDVMLSFTPQPSWYVQCVSSYFAVQNREQPLRDVLS
jgi:hypothetical protein